MGREVSAELDKMLRALMEGLCGGGFLLIFGGAELMCFDEVRGDGYIAALEWMGWMVRWDRREKAGRRYRV